MSLNRSHAPGAALGVFTLVMITAGSVDNIRNLPSTALFGSALVFFFLLATFFFLLPSALVTGELASSFPEQGGVYVWLKKAFGGPFGFLGIWFQWLENLIWYPTILAFIAGTIGYLINPALAQSKGFLITVILSSFWGITLYNLLGMKASARFSVFCTLAGLVLPMALIITLGIIWLATGHASQIQFNSDTMLPHLSHMNVWVSLIGIVLSFGGMEIATVHARDVKNPQHSFPRALIYSAIIIVTTLLLGSLTIAIVLPNKEINLVAGIMQAYHAFFAAYHLNWILPIVGVLLVIGQLGSVNNWIISPVKGLVVAAEDGHLPSVCYRENRHGAPYFLLIAQAIIVSIISLTFYLLPNVNSSYWLLTALATQVYMFMYLMLFIAGIWMRYKNPDIERAFRIPGRTNGSMWVIAGMGIIGTIVTFVVGFFPPADIETGGIERYETLIALGIIMVVVAPLILYFFRRHKVAHLHNAECSA